MLSWCIDEFMNFISLLLSSVEWGWMNTAWEENCLSIQIYFMTCCLLVGHTSIMLWCFLFYQSCTFISLYIIFHPGLKSCVHLYHRPPLWLVLYFIYYVHLPIKTCTVVWSKQESWVLSLQKSFCLSVGGENLWSKLKEDVEQCSRLFVT